MSRQPRLARQEKPEQPALNWQRLVAKANFARTAQLKFHAYGEWLKTITKAGRERIARHFEPKSGSSNRPIATRSTRTSERSPASGSMAPPERCHRDPPEPPCQLEDSCDWYDIAERLSQGDPRSYLFSQLHKGADGLTYDSDDNVVWGH